MDIETINTQQPAKACVIWMHGLGADAQDMKGLAAALNIQKPVKHICLNAPVRPVTINSHMPMRAWYDITGTTLTDREDSKGISESEELIQDAVQQQIKSGFSANHIYLAGFSQGGAMALHYGLRCADILAGVICLSAYLPLAENFKPKQSVDTPIFFAYGKMDQVVLPEWSRLSLEQIKQHGFKNVQQHTYDMGHEVCLDELTDLSEWLNHQLSMIKQPGEIE